MLIYEMLDGKPPFETFEVDEMARKNTFEWKFDHASGFGPSAKLIVYGLLERAPRRRLGNKGTAEVKSHPWFSEVEWGRLLSRNMNAVYLPPVECGVGDTSMFGEYPAPDEERHDGDSE